MKTSEMEKELLFLEENLESFNPRKYEIDKEQLNLSFSVNALCYAGNAPFNEEDEFYYDKCLEKIFQLPDVSSLLFHRNDAKKVINAVLDEARKSSITEKFFTQIFPNNAFREADRLRALTSGKKGLLVSKETEEKVIEHFFHMLRSSLLLYFSFISLEEYHRQILPHALELILIEGTNASDPYGAILFLTNAQKALSKEKKETQALLFSWYQTNNCTFFHKRDLLNVSSFLSLSFLLTKAQQRETYEQVKESFSKEILFLKERLFKRESYCLESAQAIKQYKKTLAALIEFEKEFL